MSNGQIILILALVAMGSYGARKTGNFVKNDIAKPVYHHIIHPAAKGVKAVGKHQVEK